jgi:hypothetical protein
MELLAFSDLSLRLFAALGFHSPGLAKRARLIRELLQSM